MVEFTKEWIAKARNACIFFGEPATTEFRKSLDEIERLQKENKELKEFVDALEAYISDFSPVSMEIAKKETIISKLEGKVNVASDLLESISLWFYKKVGNPDPFWTCQFESACKLFENSEEDNNETSNL